MKPFRIEGYYLSTICQCCGNSLIGFVNVKNRRNLWGGSKLSKVVGVAIMAGKKVNAWVCNKPKCTEYASESKLVKFK